MELHGECAAVRAGCGDCATWSLAQEESASRHVQSQHYRHHRPHRRLLLFLNSPVGLCVRVRQHTVDCQRLSQCVEAGGRTY